MINELTINDMKDKYLNYLVTFNAYDTFIFYRQHLRIICNFLFSINVINDDDIELNKIYDFIQSQKKNKVSNATINKRIGAFKRMLKYNKSPKYHIFTAVNRLKEDYKTFNYLDANDINKLILYLNTTSSINIRNKALISLMLDSGVRLNEVINIKLKFLDLTNNMITLDVTKTKNDRYIFFTDRTKEFLKSYVSKLNNPLLFPISKRTVRHIFDRVKRDLNFIYFSPHVLRHTYATILVNSNTNLEFIKITMGHSNLKTTSRYLHFNQEILHKQYKTHFTFWLGSATP